MVPVDAGVIHSDHYPPKNDGLSQGVEPVDSDPGGLGVNKSRRIGQAPPICDDQDRET